MAPHSSTLAWQIPWTEEPGRLQSMGLRRVGHDWATSLHFSLSCIGEGNGNPLQCSCLENPRDGGAGWAAVYGVAQSRTQLKWLSSSSLMYSYICTLFTYSITFYPLNILLKWYYIFTNLKKSNSPLGSPGGASSKEPPCQCSANAGDIRNAGSVPGWGKIPWRRAWQPTPVFLPGESPGTEEPVRLQYVCSPPSRIWVPWKYEGIVDFVVHHCILGPKVRPRAK